MEKPGKYSMGIGDRFGRQGKYQLQAFMDLNDRGTAVIPVWNKSHREHTNTHSLPSSVRKEADDSVKNLGWKLPYFVDADHITLSTVDAYLGHSNFFTIDVADQIGHPLSPADRDQFIDRYRGMLGQHNIPGLGNLQLDTDQLLHLGDQFWYAAVEAGRIYRHIKDASGSTNFITEVSMDEVPSPQSPADLYFILKFLSDNGVQMQTIAPKFPGRFNKGIDYSGDPDVFDTHFRNYLLAIKAAVNDFSLDKQLKLSIHTGSDKFSLYPVMKRRLVELNSGIHLKTAGTTWLEEVIGLAESGGLDFVKTIYSEAYLRRNELTVAYLNVLDIHPDQLPEPAIFSELTGMQIAAMIRHDPAEPAYNASVRQLMHTAYKIAAEQKKTFENLLDANSEAIGKNVYDNILNRHLVPLFL